MLTGRGQHQEAWDGRDDFGEKVSPQLYTVKLAFNNIVYSWDGVIGNTESSWAGYTNWDGIVPSFVRSLTFQNGMAYAANGYMEGGYGASVFDEASPNAQVRPLTKAVFNTLPTFTFAATDGNLLYFGFQTYGEKPQPIQGVVAFRPSGEYYRFPDGSKYPSYPEATGTFWNNSVTPPIGIPDVRAIDPSTYPVAAITGLAVERNGNLLATAHGFYQPGGDTKKAVPSANEIRLWNKSTGTLVGSLSLPNPQGMVFDLQNNLWVISGYGSNDILYRVTGVGNTNLVDRPIHGLSNPMSVAVSPKTGSIFVADGGSSQQIKEFDDKFYHLMSSLGNVGGYFSSEGCNSTVSNTTFWFDPGPNMNRMPVVGTNSPFVSWVAVAERGDLWVGDFSTSRILHFDKTGATWRYVDRLMYLPWSYNSSVPFDSPTRVFGGPTGFLEFKVNYSVPIQPGDPDGALGNHSWQLVRNWLPCFIHQDPNADLATEMSAYSFPNKKVIGFVQSDTLGACVPYYGLMKPGVSRSNRFRRCQVGLPLMSLAIFIKLLFSTRVNARRFLSKNMELRI